MIIKSFFKKIIFNYNFLQLFGHLCFKCSQPCGSEVFQALGKTWCVKCFSCSLCDKKMDQK